MSAFPPPDEQLAALLRGAAQVETAAELRKKLEHSYDTGRPLRVKYGIDPTGFDVHLGHTVPLRKLRQFQQFGHTAVLIIGTATAEVGDPSGRAKERAGLTPEQIAANADSYLAQIARVVDVSRAEVRPNGEWFHRFTFAQMLRLLGSMTVQRMTERDDFAKRIAAGQPIFLHECLYPLMQGHDSVEVTADVELGGTEQLFNLMVGRNLQRDAGQPPQVALTMPILRGLDGVQKMGKSLGNYIGLAESAKDQFEKTMRIPNELMREWFTLLTDRTPEGIDAVLAGHPIEAKNTLAEDVVAFYHGREAAAAARREFINYKSGGDPSEIPEVVVSAAEGVGGAFAAPKLLTLAGLTKSNGEARKKIEEGAVTVGPDRERVADWKAQLTVPAGGLVVRLGRRIVRVRAE